MEQRTPAEENKVKKALKKRLSKTVRKDEITYKKTNVHYYFVNGQIAALYTTRTYCALEVADKRADGWYAVKFDSKGDECAAEKMNI